MLRFGITRPSEGKVHRIASFLLFGFWRQNNAKAAPITLWRRAHPCFTPLCENLLLYILPTAGRAIICQISNLRKYIAIGRPTSKPSRARARLWRHADDATVAATLRMDVPCLHQQLSWWLVLAGRHGEVTFEMASGRAERLSLGIFAIGVSSGSAIVCGLLAQGTIVLSDAVPPLWLVNALPVVILARAGPGRLAASLPPALLVIVLASVLTTDTALQSIGVSLGNFGEIALVWLGLHVTGCSRFKLTSIRDVLIFSTVGGFLAPACSGIPISMMLAPSDPQNWTEIWMAWVHFHGAGMMITVLPVLMIIDNFRNIHRIFATEWVIMGVMGGSVTIYIFWQTHAPLMFLTIPLTITSAIEFGMIGVAMSTLSIAIISYAFTAIGLGPLSLMPSDINTKFIIVQNLIITNISIGIVTSILLLQKELLAAKAHKANFTKTIFLANISHDLRTPMNGILGYAELLLNGKLKDDQRIQVQKIKNSGKAMSHLLNDILDIARAETGEFSFKKENFDLHQTLTDCRDIVSPDADRKNIYLELDIADDFPRYVMSDRHRLRQIVLNLISNAIKFTQQGSVAIRAKASPISDGRMTLRISVEDTGIGIDPEHTHLIFKPFEQVNPTATSYDGGIGLGLALSSRLAGLLGGSIGVQSELGQGSVFTLQLPVKIAERPQLPKQDPATIGALQVTASSGKVPMDKITCSRGRVLLVEDHDINQDLIREMLQYLNYEVELAVNGRDAISKVNISILKGRKFDLVLMDLRMPVLDGYEAARMIRSGGISSGVLPIIALTANSYPEDIAAAMDAGMQAHLAKPINMDELRWELEKWIPQPRWSKSSGSDRPAAEAPNARRNRLGELYRKHRADALYRLEVLARMESVPEEELNEILELLHKLAGTAGVFGEAELGRQAGALEEGLKRWSVSERPANFREAARSILCLAAYASKASPDQGRPGA